MEEDTRGEVVPEPRYSRNRRRLAAVLVGAAVAYSGALGLHKAHDQAGLPAGSMTEGVPLLDNIRSAPRLGAKVSVRARTTEPTDDDLGNDVEALTAALALVVLAATRLPKGSPARRELAQDAKRLRLALVDSLRAT